MENNFLKTVEQLWSKKEKSISSHYSSVMLYGYYFYMAETFIYGTLIKNLFNNLTKRNVKESGLARGQIGIIKEKYKKIKKEINSSLRFSVKSKIIDFEYYKRFKNEIENDLPESKKIICGIEKINDLENIKNYLKKKQEKIKELGKNNINSYFLTKVLEIYIQKTGRLPPFSKISMLIKVIGKDVLPKFAKDLFGKLCKRSRVMLQKQEVDFQGFRNRLYVRWKIPIDLFECMIRVSLESVETHRKMIDFDMKKDERIQSTVLIYIHARSIQISNEIISLLKSGYADGANARWRSLHELAVISLFLRHNSAEVSLRYLEHDTIKRFKEAKDYKVYCRKLGYVSLQTREFNSIRKSYKRLCKKYPDNFQGDYGWIPRHLLNNRNFRELERHVKLDYLHPFYNLSCNAVHGGARGFYRLGLMESKQNKILLIGSSNYGLADPLQNAGVSLLHITVSMLSLNPNLESMIGMYVMLNYQFEIAREAVKAQKSIEIEERLLKKYSKQ